MAKKSGLKVVGGRESARFDIDPRKADQALLQFIKIIETFYKDNNNNPYLPVNLREALAEWDRCRTMVYGRILDAKTCLQTIRALRIGQIFRIDQPPKAE